MITVTIKERKHIDNCKSYDLETIYSTYKEYIENYITYNEFIDWYKSTYIPYLKTILGRYYPIKYPQRVLIKLIHSNDFNLFIDVVEDEEYSYEWLGGLDIKDLLYRLCNIYLLKYLSKGGSIDYELL